MWKMTVKCSIASYDNKDLKRKYVIKIPSMKLHKPVHYIWYVTNAISDISANFLSLICQVKDMTACSNTAM